MWAFLDLWTFLDLWALLDLWAFRRPGPTKEALVAKTFREGLADCEILYRRSRAVHPNAYRYKCLKSVHAKQVMLQRNRDPIQCVRHYRSIGHLDQEKS